MGPTRWILKGCKCCVHVAESVLVGMAIFARRDRRGLGGSTKSDTAVPELKEKKEVVLIHKPVN